MKKSQAELVRCTWAANEINTRYHDEEWGVPVRDDRRWFEFLILEGAQAGLSWDTILNKRQRYREVFAQFDPAQVAKFDARKKRELLRDLGCTEMQGFLFSRPLPVEAIRALLLGTPAKVAAA